MITPISLYQRARTQLSNSTANCLLRLPVICLNSCFRWCERIHFTHLLKTRDTHLPNFPCFLETGNLGSFLSQKCNTTWRVSRQNPYLSLQFMLHGK